MDRVALQTMNPTIHIPFAGKTLSMTTEEAVALRDMLIQHVGPAPESFEAVFHRIYSENSEKTYEFAEGTDRNFLYHCDWPKYDK